MASKVDLVPIVKGTSTSASKTDRYYTTYHEGLWTFDAFVSGLLSMSLMIATGARSGDLTMATSGRHNAEIQNPEG